MTRLRAAAAFNIFFSHTAAVHAAEDYSSTLNAFKAATQGSRKLSTRMGWLCSHTLKAG